MDLSEPEETQNNGSESKVRIINEPSILNDSSSSQHVMLQNTNPVPSPRDELMEGRKPL